MLGRGAVVESGRFTGPLDNGNAVLAFQGRNRLNGAFNGSDEFEDHSNDRGHLGLGSGGLLVL